jgi:hypothetical protein
MPDEELNSFQARSIQNATHKALDVVATQAAFPDSTRFKPQKKLHVTKKNWRNTAALRATLQPANSDYASGATLATEGDDVAWPNKAEAGHLKKVTGSNRSGSAAGDEADWDAQSFHSGGLESEAPHANLLDEPCESLVPTLMMCSFYGVPVTAIPSAVCLIQSILVISPCMQSSFSVHRKEILFDMFVHVVDQHSSQLQ